MTDPYASYDDLYRPTQPEPAEAEPEQICGEPIPAPTNPMGVARRAADNLFTDRGKLILRTHRGDFYRYDGTCYPEAEARGVRGGLYRWLEDAVYVKGTKIVPWEPNRHKLEDVLDALRAVSYVDGRVDAPVWVEPHDHPAGEMVSFANGLLHVPTRELIPHSADFFCHNSMPFEYDLNCPYPSRWLQFMKQLWKDDEESISTLQEIFGYILAGGTSQQKMFLLIGPKRGGKGTIGRVLRGLLGHHNVTAPILASLATNFGLQDLIGKPLAIVSDARLGKVDRGVVVERLLSISGEDALTVDRKYREPWTGQLPSRFLILTNELPQLHDSSGAFASRFILLILKESFLGQENPGLSAELLEEAPGILNWALDGLDRLKDRGHFRMPTSSADAVRQLEDLASPMSTFLRECCELGPDLSVPVDALWDAWKSWTDDQGRGAGTKSVFGRDLTAAASLVHKVRSWNQGSRLYEYAGIGLGDGEHEDDPERPEQWSIPRTARTAEDKTGQNAPETGFSPGSPSNSSLLSPLGHHGHQDAP